MNELVAELVRLRPWTWTDPDQCEFPFVFDPTLGNEARQVDYPTRVLLGRKFFDLPESTRWATAFHEVGHVLSDMGLVDGWAWDLVDLLPSWGHLNGQTTPGEVAAEAWSIWNTEPSFLLENAPGIAAVMDEVAPAAGFPRVASALPDVDFSVASEPQWGSARCRLSPMRDGRVALSQLTSTARGNGDGGQLVRLIAEQAAAQGITLVLDTVEPRLVSWYEGLGFHETWRDADYEEWVRMEKTASDEPVIIGAKVHYGFPTVWVEPYRVTNHYGDEYLIDHFWLNGPAWPTAHGRRIKKNGEPYATSTDFAVALPANVRAAFDELEAGDAIARRQASLSIGFLD